MDFSTIFRNEEMGNMSKFKEDRRNIPNSIGHEREYFKYILMTIFGFLFFYSPYLRGLYFEDEQFPAQVISFILLVGVMIYKNIKQDKIFLRTPLDYSFFGMTLVYGLSVFVAVNTRSAISEFLKYAFYFACFYTTSQLFTAYKHKLILVWVSIVSVLGVSVISIDAAIGPRGYNAAGNEITYGPLSVFLNNFLEVLHLKKSFFDIYLFGKIYATYQYSNAFASVALAVFVLCVVLIVNANKQWERGILGAVAYFIFNALMLTQSRGVILLVPFVLILLVLAVGKGARARTTVYAMIPIALNTISYIITFDFVNNAVGHEVEARMVYLATCILAAGIVMMAGFVTKYLEKYWMVCGGIIAALFLGGLIVGYVVLTSPEDLKLDLTTKEDKQGTYVQKELTLEGGKDYKLNFEVEGRKGSGVIYNYYIKIFNKDIKDILTDKSQEILFQEGEAVGARKKVDVNFTVPRESKSMVFEFGNHYQDSSSTFYSAQIMSKENPFNTISLNLKYKYLPPSIARRFENLNAAKSVIERSIFNKDGFEVFKERWLMGSGGGAWSHLYSSKQSYYYTTTQAHNFILQLAIETGIIGLLVFLFLISSAKIMFLSEFVLQRIGENETRERILQGGLITAAAGMFIHSILDFDFSLSAVFLLFCVYLALFNSRYANITTGDIKSLRLALINKVLGIFRGFTFDFPKLKIWNGFVITVYSLLIFLPISLYNGLSSSELARAYMKDNPQISVTYAKEAIASDPFKVDYRNLFVNAIINAKSKNKMEIQKKDVEDVEENLKTAFEKSRYSSSDSYATGSNYINIGEIDKALEMYKTSVFLSPRREADWGLYIGANLRACLILEDDDKLNEAIEIARKAVEIPKVVMEKNKSNLVPFEFGADTLQSLEVLEYLKNHSQKNTAYQRVVFYSFKDWVDADLNHIPDQWETESAKMLNLSYNKGLFLKNSTGKVTQLNSRKLSLQAGEKYNLEITMEKDSLQNKKMDEMVFQIDGMDSKQHAIWDKESYKATIETPQNYTKVDPILRLEIPQGEWSFDRISLIRDE